MTKTVGELLADTLAQIGVRQIFGIVGDALNPLRTRSGASRGARFGVAKLREGVLALTGG